MNVTREMASKMFCICNAAAIEAYRDYDLEKKAYRRSIDRYNQFQNCDYTPRATLLLEWKNMAACNAKAQNLAELAESYSNLEATFARILEKEYGIKPVKLDCDEEDAVYSIIKTKNIDLVQAIKAFKNGIDVRGVGPLLAYYACAGMYMGAASAV